MHKRILIVDDDPDVVEIFALMLEKEYAVTTERDVRRLLDGPEGIVFDLIVIDHRLNQLTSTEIIPLLRRKPGFRHTPILIYSGDSRLEEIAQAAGAEGFIPKPSSLDVIRRRVAAALAAAGPAV